MEKRFIILKPNYAHCLSTVRFIKPLTCHVQYTKYWRTLMYSCHHIARAREWRQVIMEALANADTHVYKWRHVRVSRAT